MSRTSNTSARITKRDAKTTERVVDRPTPSVPPLVRIPSKQAIAPMMRPYTAVLSVEGRKSPKSTCLKPLCRKYRMEIDS